MPFRIKRTYDMKTVHRLDRKIFPTDHPLKIKDYGAYWLIDNGKKPVGFCAIHPLSQEPNTCFLARSGILSKYRGKGLQRRMIQVRERWARKEGYEYLLTYTMPFNGPSIASLIKNNYMIYEPAYSWAGKDVLYFIKNLKKM